MPTGSALGDDTAKMPGAIQQNVVGVYAQIKGFALAGLAFETLVAGTDHFGIGAVKIGGTPLVLTLGNGNDDLLAGITGDFKVNEI